MTTTFIREYDGWPGINVEYLATYDNGSTQKCLCSKDEWIIIDTKKQLLAAGVSESLLDKFEEAVRDVAREDEWMSNAGEEL